jgi:hypothetical protein
MVAGLPPRGCPIVKRALRILDHVTESAFLLAYGSVADYVQPGSRVWSYHCRDLSKDGTGSTSTSSMSVAQALSARTTLGQEHPCGRHRLKQQGAVG